MSALGTSQVIRANSRNLPLADNSVDLIVTSPPYFALRSYQDGGEHYTGQVGDEATPTEFVDSLIEVTRECMRVLKPSGSMWDNLGDKYAGSGMGGNTSLANSADYKEQRAKGYHPEWNTAASDTTTDQASNVTTGAPARRASSKDLAGIRSKSLCGLPWRYALRCIDDLGLILRAEVIWSKPNGLPESVTDRVRRSHEQWFHFTLEPRYFSAVDEIRESQDTAERKGPRRSYPPGSASSMGATGEHQAMTGSFAGLPLNPLGKLPGSVWTIPTEPLRVPDHLGIDHFAAFPTAFPKRIIEGWSAPGMTILDPFGGTGATAMVAKALGRHGITVDMSQDYCRLAEWRTNDRNQLAKVLGHAKVEQQPDDQMDMLDLLGGEGA